VIPVGRSEGGSRGRGLISALPGGSGGYARPALRPVLRGNSLDWMDWPDAGNTRWRLVPYVDGPRLARGWAARDRIACDHMSGLLSRSHMTAAKMGSATRVPNRKATF